MNKFVDDYLKLLRNQVTEEMNYLTTNDHEQKEIMRPCMFCKPHKKGHYTCLRLAELRQFLSTIVQNQALMGNSSIIAD